MSTISQVIQKLRLPIVGAPMFIVSSKELVIEQCKAGIVGSFPALNARPQESLEDWLRDIKTALAEHDAANPSQPSAPYAVNQIVHGSNVRLEHDLELCIKYEVPIIICSLGARQEFYDAIHAYGGLVLHDVVNNKYAKKAVEKGADGLVAVAAGAGGHAGTQSPFALMQEIREWYDGPVGLSGCIANGRSILAARAMGADFAYIGSPFIATEQANAEQAYKEAIVTSDADGIIYTNLFSGSHANYLRSSIESAGLDPDNLPASAPDNLDFGAGDVIQAKAWKDVWGCGQGVGAIKKVTSIEELVSRFEQEYNAAAEKFIP
jgi:nitronate monooxygenase